MWSLCSWQPPILGQQWLGRALWECSMPVTENVQKGSDPVQPSPLRPSVHRTVVLCHLWLKQWPCSVPSSPQTNLSTNPLSVFKIYSESHYPFHPVTATATATWVQTTSSSSLNSCTSLHLPLLFLPLPLPHSSSISFQNVSRITPCLHLEPANVFPALNKTSHMHIHISPELSFPLTFPFYFCCIIFHCTNKKYTIYLIFFCFLSSH